MRVWYFGPSRGWELSFGAPALICNHHFLLLQRFHGPRCSTEFVYHSIRDIFVCKYTRKPQNRAKSCKIAQFCRHLNFCIHELLASNQCFHGRSSLWPPTQCCLFHTFVTNLTLLVCLIILSIWSWQYPPVISHYNRWYFTLYISPHILFPLNKWCKMARTFFCFFQNSNKILSFYFFLFLVLV